MVSWIQEALMYSAARTHQNLAELTSFPEVAQGGCWQCVDDGGWVGGHWVGLLWLAYEHTGEDSFQRAARTWAARLAPRQRDETTHDLGFLFDLAYIQGARLTGDEGLKPPALTAARTLSRRFNARANFLQAWGTPDAAAPTRGRMIIDTLMNLNLLYWAGAETGNPLFAHVASSHAYTALARLVRPDGSTAHVADFDPDTGAFIRQDTHQGFSPTSCWSRGQAWGAYGFGQCFANTGDASFLSVARKLSDYALRRLPPDCVPFWDYDSPLIPNDVRDSSAAAILAAGLVKLAAMELDAGLSVRWRMEAVRILESLWESYSSRATVEPCILLHATRNRPRGAMDHGLIYGDYYFVEALTGLTRQVSVEEWQGNKNR